MAIGSTPDSRSVETKTRLPRDLDIFAPSRPTIPLCRYAWANGWSVATRASPADISWCGKIRSLPPPWTSKSGPSRSRAIAVHSMCQPGRPAPEAGIPGRLAVTGQPPDQAVQRRLLARAVGIAAPLGEELRSVRGLESRASEPNSSSRRLGEVQIGVRRGRPPHTPLLGPATARSVRRSRGIASTAPTECRGGKHVQRGHVLAVELDLLLGQFGPLDPGRPRPGPAADRPHRSRSARS